MNSRITSLHEAMRLYTFLFSPNSQPQEQSICLEISPGKYFHWCSKNFPFPCRQINVENRGGRGVREDQHVDHWWGLRNGWQAASYFCSTLGLITFPRSNVFFPGEPILPVKKKASNLRARRGDERNGKCLGGIFNLFPDLRVFRRLDNQNATKKLLHSI